MHSPLAPVYHAQGGRATARAARAERLLPSRLLPVVEALERALRGVERGEVDARTGLAMAGIASALVRVVTAGETEERLRALEQHAHDEKLDRDRLGRPRNGGPLPWDKIIG